LITLPAETPRLILRPFHETDIAAFAAYRSDPEVARYQGWDIPYTLTQATEFVAAMQRAQPGVPGEWYQVAITIKDDGRRMTDDREPEASGGQRTADYGPRTAVDGLPGIDDETRRSVVCRLFSPLLVGDCAFYRLANDPLQAEIGITLAQAYQGQGYAAEALDWLVGELFRAYDLHRIRANCDVENLASARLLERLGFRREAHFIENLWFKGRWSSEFWYALLRREWEAQCSRQ